MESFTLIKLVDELTEKVAGSRVEKVRQASAQSIAIKLDHRWLLISADSRQPRIHFVGKQARELEPGRFVLLAQKHLHGARLRVIEQPTLDRVVYLRFTGLLDQKAGEPSPVELTLVAELIGRSANLFLLDQSNRVIERLCERADDRNAAGELYIAPASRGKLDPLTLTREEFEAVIAQDDSPAEMLVKRIAGFGPLYAAEVEARWRVTNQNTSPASASSLFDSFTSVLDDLFNKPTQPTIYSPVRLDTIVPASLRPADLILSPIPLVQAAGMIATRFESLSEAAAEFYRLVQKVEDFHKQKASVISNLKSNTEKRQRLIRNLEADLKRLGDYESLRRCGELLLANATTAKPTSAGFIVSDYYDPEQRQREIPTESKASPQKAAEDYFARYRKAKRGHATISEKITAAHAEIERFTQLILKAQAAKTVDELVALSQQISGPRLRRRSQAHPVGPPKKAGKREKFSGVYCFVSSDNHEILVGKSDEDNDRLTFKYAAPHDIWLHAADYPGSHVILRKSKGAPVPHRSLVEAAQLAAYFSKARHAGKVAVYYTERKFVSKIRHSRPGLVRLADFKSITVEPAINAERILKE
jgi:predicted ribosome quality control (RQC) complex YloA/Tae2 family protein